jgi:hypothetical protein
MNQDTKLGFLKDEYLLLQKFYEDFDARIITIKGWSATVGLAAIGGGFFQSQYPLDLRCFFSTCVLEHGSSLEIIPVHV